MISRCLIGILLVCATPALTDKRIFSQVERSQSTLNLRDGPPMQLQRTTEDKLPLNITKISKTRSTKTLPKRTERNVKDQIFYDMMPFA